MRTQIQMIAIDIQNFCAREQQANGTLSEADLPRLRGETTAIEYVNWTAIGASVARHKNAQHAGKPLLALRIQARLGVPCVRCLTPVNIAIDLSPNFVFFESDAEADAALVDDETLQAAVIQPRFDLAACIEDEILLAIEERARHETCPPEALKALGLAVEDDLAKREEATRNPFVEALKPLRKH